MTSAMSSVADKAKSAVSSLFTGSLAKTFDKDDVVVVGQAEADFSAHLIGLLVHNGVKVRAITWNNESADLVNKAMAHIPRHKELLEVVTCSDPTDPAACETILRGATYLAYPLAKNPGTFGGDAEHDMVRPSVDSVPCILECAKRAQTIKKVCLISSTSALGDPAKTGQHFTADSWLPVTREEACQMKDVTQVFAACNALAEKTAWEWFKACGDKPPFGLTVVLPAHVVGPELLAVDPRGINRKIVDALTGHEVVPLGCTGFVDARDVAKTIADVLQDRSTDGKRLVLDAGASDYKKMTELAKSVEGFKLQPSPDIATMKPAETASTYDESLTSLKVQYTPLEHSLKDMLKQAVSHGVASTSHGGEARQTVTA